MAAHPLYSNKPESKCFNYVYLTIAGTSPLTSPVMAHDLNPAQDVLTANVKALAKERSLESTRKGKQKTEVVKQIPGTMLVCTCKVVTQVMFSTKCICIPRIF